MMKRPETPRRVVLGTLAGAATVQSASNAPALAQGGLAIDLVAGSRGLPEGFTAARTGRGGAATWSVQEDDTVPGRRALTQTSTDPTDFRFPLAIYDRISAADIAVSVRFKAVAGRVDRAGGLMVRLTDADNYYVVRANALEDNVNFYRVVRGARREIHGARIAVPSDVWHSLELRAAGDRFTISFNDRDLFTTSDSTFAAAGKFGLWTKADSITRFDALRYHTI
jgi:hypothetical protein